MVPFFVEKSILAIEKRGIDSEGIYRKSGLQTQVRQLIDLWNNSKLNGEDINMLDDNVWPDINVISASLKMYFR